MAKFMVGEDQTNKPDLHATPEPDQQPEPEQKDAPLPAFIYGRDGHGDGNGRAGLRAGDRQNFNARIADMDRKTLLGLVTGAGMLGLVLFFAGMLVGAGLFMDSDEGAPGASIEKAPVEMLATAPEEPAVISEPVPQTEPPAPAAEIANQSDDPVGALIAQRSEALDDAVDEAQKDVAETTGEAVDAASEMTASANLEETGTLSAPEIRDVAESRDAGDAPAAPVVEEKTAATSAEVGPTPLAPPAPPAPKASEPVAETAKAAEPAAAPASAGEVATNGETPFSVQVGAFKVHENASQRAEELRKKGLSVAVVVRGAADDSAWYYVRIGKFATLKEARDDAAKIKKDHALDGFPVRAEPNDREVN
ncbi:SPOR domain-containing protein [Thalassospira sp. CH_XMU1448-2]|uniref:SPOR domain-containing protein n=1 Tax=Thalassospira sp. CH_XMU1448-2 TaxID=3107773 RepID=UPI003009E068